MRRRATSRGGESDESDWRALWSQLEQRRHGGRSEPTHGREREQRRTRWAASSEPPPTPSTASDCLHRGEMLRELRSGRANRGGPTDRNPNRRRNCPLPSQCRRRPRCTALSARCDQRCAARSRLPWLLWLRLCAIAERRRRDRAGPAADCPSPSAECAF